MGRGEMNARERGPCCFFLECCTVPELFLGMAETPDGVKVRINHDVAIALNFAI